MNEYRFIETTLDENGKINLNKHKYVSVSNDIIEKANDIVRCQPVFLKNSVLPESQIKLLAQN